MPRYFFHVHDGHDISDDVGEELTGLAHARRHAVQLAGALLRDHADKVWQGEEWKMDVTDENGLVLFTLLFLAVDAPSTARL